MGKWKAGAFDITVTFPLCPTFLGEVSQVVGAAALGAETRQHTANDKKGQELAVETYGNWGQEAKQTLPRLAFCLATDSSESSQPKSKVIIDLYGRLNLTLMRAIARTILA